MHALHPIPSDRAHIAIQAARAERELVSLAPDRAAPKTRPHAHDRQRWALTMQGSPLLSTLPKCRICSLAAQPGAARALRSTRSIMQYAIQRAPPAAQLVMIDPKQVELSHSRITTPCNAHHNQRGEGRQNAAKRQRLQWISDTRAMARKRTKSGAEARISLTWIIVLTS